MVFIRRYLLGMDSLPRYKPEFLNRDINLSVQVAIVYYNHYTVSVGILYFLNYIPSVILVRPPIGRQCPT